jgi:anti-anti-sigma factor
VESSQILVARDGDHACLRVVGRGSFQNAALVKNFYTEVTPTGVAHFTLDLEECTYLDSTFLGTLTGLGVLLRDKRLNKLQIVNCNSRNKDLLQNLGLDRLFDISSRPPETDLPAPEALAPLPPTRDNTGEIMLEAHECLMKWDPRNVAKFKDVVAFLKEDLSKGE